jgi:hypothetical protein
VLVSFYEGNLSIDLVFFQSAHIFWGFQSSLTSKGKCFHINFSSSLINPFPQLKVVALSCSTSMSIMNAFLTTYVKLFSLYQILPLPPTRFFQNNPDKIGFAFKL